MAAVELIVTSVDGDSNIHRFELRGPTNEARAEEVRHIAREYLAPLQVASGAVFIPSDSKDVIGLLYRAENIATVKVMFRSDDMEAETATDLTYQVASTLGLLRQR